MAGAFIAFEGGEGGGKSTQVGLLVEELQRRGLDVVRTREPGGTPAAEAIRAVLLDPANEGLDPRSEALLFAAARGEHVARVIRPALARGAVVISDRYVDSSLAYQGVARGLGVDRVLEISMWATCGLLPDLTVVLDIDPAAGLARATDPNRLEAESLEWHRMVRQGFLDLAARDPQRYVVLDATRSVDEIAADVQSAVAALL